jgi:hypothetical protein
MPEQAAKKSGTDIAAKKRGDLAITIPLQKYKFLIPAGRAMGSILDFTLLAALGSTRESSEKVSKSR